MQYLQEAAEAPDVEYHNSRIWQFTGFISRDTDP